MGQPLATLREVGLHDRSSTPHTSPNATPPDVVGRIETRRRENKWSAQRITGELRSIGISIHRRTVSRHLARLGLGRRRFIDPNGENNRQPGKIIARWPGHMAHLDVEKVGRIPNGGRLPCTGQGLVRRPRDQPHPPCRHRRQRRLLPIRRLRTDHRPPDSAPEDKALHPSAQRQSRALPTHPGRRTTTGHTALPAASRQPRGFAKASPTSSPPTPSRWVPRRRMGK